MGFALCTAKKTRQRLCRVQNCIARHTKVTWRRHGRDGAVTVVPPPLCRASCTWVPPENFAMRRAFSCPFGCRGGLFAVCLARQRHLCRVQRHGKGPSIFSILFQIFELFFNLISNPHPYTRGRGPSSARLTYKFSPNWLPRLRSHLPAHSMLSILLTPKLCCHIILFFEF